MVVVRPPPSMFMPRSAADYYVVLEVVYEDLSASSGDIILEIDDDDGESVDAAADEPCWDPLQHLDELPLRPMSRARKACIDVAFVVLTAAMEAGLARAALHDGGVGFWLVGLPLMLPFMLGFLYLAVLMYLMATRDFSGVVGSKGSKPTGK